MNDPVSHLLAFRGEHYETVAAVQRVWNLPYQSCSFYSLFSPLAQIIDILTQGALCELYVKLELVLCEDLVFG